VRRTRVEDYLAAIQQICDQTERDRATTGHVARLLEVSKGTASSSLKQLAEDGLIDHVPYDGVSLTAEGRALAQRTVKRRRLMRLFLTSSLGPWDAVEEEAARREFAASDELMERIDNILGRPC
jgi:DtxR family Mn-dependent transcriptional regulator